MITLSPETVAVLMLGGIFAGVLLGYPLAISIGGVGIVIARERIVTAGAEDGLDADKTIGPFAHGPAGR